MTSDGQNQIARRLVTIRIALTIRFCK